MSGNIDKDFIVPVDVKGDSFLLKPLSPEYAELDFEAITSNVKFLKGSFGPSNPWPPEDLTLDQDKEDIDWHYDNFLKRNEFAYIIMDHQKAKSFGCLYIIPIDFKGYDVLVFSWLIEDKVTEGFDSYFSNFINGWLEAHWKFKKPLFPGRNMPWEVWEKEVKDNRDKIFNHD